MAKTEITNTEMIEFNQKLMEMGLSRITGSNPDALELIKLRTDEYYELCKQYNKMPTWTGLALVYGVDRKTLMNWRDGVAEWARGKVSEFVQLQWAFLNSFHEQGMLEGSISAVPGIFIGKNNFGYINEDRETVVHELSGHWSVERLIEESKSLEIANKQ